MIPTLVLGLLGGLLADRANRYWLLVITQGVITAISLLMTLVLLLGVVQVWHGYVTAVVTGTAWALCFPARRALVYDLLGSSELTNAIALDTVGLNVSRMVGPALAGVLIDVIGVSGSFVFITAGNVLGLLLVYLIQVPPRQRSEANSQQAQPQQSILKNLSEGFSYVRTEPVIMATIWITLFINLLLFSYSTMVPIIARDILHVGPALIGALLAAEGLGALVGSMYMASAINLRYHGRIYVGGSLLALIGLLGTCKKV